MISEKKTEEKVELSLQELEEITGGYVFEGTNINEINIYKKISQIKPPILSGNIILFPKPTLPPPILTGAIIVW